MYLNTLDLLYVSLAMSSLIIAFAIGYVLYQVGKTIQHIKLVAGDTQDLIHDISSAKNLLKIGLLKTLSKLVNTKGGDS